MIGADVRSPDDRRQGEVLAEVEPEDLLKFGLIPEFVGRLPVVATLEALDRAGQLVLQYADDDAGRPTNPNGSVRDVAGVCDPTGRILGLMPHPERFIEATQHPAWMGRLDPTAEAAGLMLFRNAIRAASGDAG